MVHLFLCPDRGVWGFFFGTHGQEIKFIFSPVTLNFINLTAAGREQKVEDKKMPEKQTLLSK